MMRRTALMSWTLLLAAALTGCTLKDQDGVRADGTIAAPPDVAAPPADALRTESGIASKVLRLGTGSAHPTPESTVVVHYTGWTTDGEMFDSSVARGAPATFELGQVIPGWTEGLQLMVAGEKRRFWIPGNLAYDDLPPEKGYPRGMLVFDIDLIAIE